MSYDSQGNFTRLHNWEQDRQNDIEIMSDRHDEEDDNFAEGLNECLLRDGRVALSGNLNMGNYQIKNVARASGDNDAVNLAQVTDIKNSVLDEIYNVISELYYVGDIKTSLQTENHGDWLLCDGQAVSRTEYADLFAVIGTGFGVGDGINTFNVPDYRGKFLRGLGGDSAANVYTTQSASNSLTDHIHGFGYNNENNAGTFAATASTATYDMKANSGTRNWNGSEGGGTYNGDTSTYSANMITTLPTTSGNEDRPINMAVNYFIKAKG